MSWFRWTLLGFPRSSPIHPHGVTLQENTSIETFQGTFIIYHDCPDPPSFLREDAELLVFIIRHQDVTLMVRAGSSWVLEESSKYFNVLHEVTAERKLEDVDCIEAGVNDNDRISKEREKSELGFLLLLR